MKKLKFCAAIGLILASCAASKIKKSDKGPEETEINESCYQIVCRLYQENKQIPKFSELQRILDSPEDEKPKQCLKNTLEQISGHNYFAYFGRCSLKYERLEEIMKFYLTEDLSVPDKLIDKRLQKMKLEGACGQLTCRLYENQEYPLLSSLWWQVHEHSYVHPNKELAVCYANLAKQVSVMNPDYFRQCGFSDDKITEILIFYAKNSNK